MLGFARFWQSACWRDALRGTVGSRTPLWPGQPVQVWLAARSRQAHPRTWSVALPLPRVRPSPRANSSAKLTAATLAGAASSLLSAGGSFAEVSRRRYAATLAPQVWSCDFEEAGGFRLARITPFDPAWCGDNWPGCMSGWDNSSEADLSTTKTIGEVAGSSDNSTLATHTGPGGTSVAFRIYNDDIGVSVVVVEDGPIGIDATELALPPVWDYFS